MILPALRFRIIGVRVGVKNLALEGPDFVVELRRVVKHAPNGAWVDYSDTYAIAVNRDDAQLLGQKIGEVVNTVVDAGEESLGELAAG